MFSRLGNLIKGFFSLFISGIEKRNPEALLELEQENLRKQIANFNQGLATIRRDIYVSAGSACSKGHRSHVLEAMGVDAAWIDGSVRVSLSDETTEDDIRALAEALPAVLTELRGGGRRA